MTVKPVMKAELHPNPYPLLEELERETRFNSRLAWQACSTTELLPL